MKQVMVLCRDAGNREDRQKARLMWLVEACGVDQFRKNIARYMGLDDLASHVHVEYKDEWKRRDVIGIHPQKQVQGYLFFASFSPKTFLVCLVDPTMRSVEADALLQQLLFVISFMNHKS